LAKEKPPILGMLRRGGEVVIRTLEHVKQVTIGPLIERTIAEGAPIYTDEYDIDGRLVERGYGHETACHAAGESARDDDGDGSREVHVNALGGSWSLLRSWPRPHRGIPQGGLPPYLGFFEFVHNVRARGNRLLGSLIGPLLAPPRNSSWADWKIFETHSGRLHPMDGIARGSGCHHVDDTAARSVLGRAADSMAQSRPELPAWLYRLPVRGRKRRRQPHRPTSRWPIYDRGSNPTSRCPHGSDRAT
jgi:transposase-like protein